MKLKSSSHKKVRIKLNKELFQNNQANRTAWTKKMQAKAKQKLNQNQNQNRSSKAIKTFKVTKKLINAAE